jgi:phage gpG-like protein
MARKRHEQVEDESPVELAEEETPAQAPEPKPAPQKPVAKVELTPLQRAVAAIATHRQNDKYKLNDHPDYVQYKNSAGRLIASANKKILTIDKTTGHYKVDNDSAMVLANEVLARYKNFSESKVIDSKQVDSVLIVVTTDGEKYRYDLTANALTS